MVAVMVPLFPNGIREKKGTSLTASPYLDQYESRLSQIQRELGRGWPFGLRNRRGRQYLSALRPDAVSP
jgi:hypothetical protein